MAYTPPSVPYKSILGRKMARMSPHSAFGCWHWIIEGDAWVPMKQTREPTKHEVKAVRAAIQRHVPGFYLFGRRFPFPRI